MKKYYFAAIALLLASCASDEPMGSAFSENDATIVANVPDFKMEGGSRTTLTPTSEGMSFAWNSNDKLAVYGADNRFTNFEYDPVASAEETSPNTAIFRSDVFMLAQGERYACIYPLHYDDANKVYSVYKPTDYPVSFTGQTQTANESGAHLGAYDYLVATGTALTKHRCPFTFNHLCAVVKVKVTLDGAHTLKNLKIHSNGAEFTTAGKVDLTAETPTITSTATSSDITLALGEEGNGISVTADNAVLTAYLIVPAVNLSSTTLDISVDVDDATYTEEGLAGKNLTAGGAFAFAFDYAPAPSHEYVDLGLPSGTLWATTNIGAENPEDYGLYLQWGDTKGYTSDTGDGMVFDWSTYKYCKGNDTSFTKYCTISSKGYNGFTDNKTELDLDDDAAYVNWGSDWCMPSKEQFAELINTSYTTTMWTTENGVKGRKIMKKSDNSVYIFLPAVGYRRDSNLSNSGSYGNYWSRTLKSVDPYCAWYIYFVSTTVLTGEDRRSDGHPVRPVRR